MTKNNNKSSAAGGSATGGGIDFQAAVTTICSISLALGSRLEWLSGFQNDIPVKVDSETGGAGDDIALEFLDGSIAEVQVKKGLQKGERLWEPLLKLSQAISDNSIDYGILVVCSNSSDTVKSKLSNDLIRLTSNRSDSLHEITKEFIEKLEQQSLSITEVAPALRIVVIHALDADTASIKAAKSELRHICSDVKQINNAWNAIYRESNKWIKRRSGATLALISQLLRSENILLKTEASPLIDINNYMVWAEKANSDFSILGANKPLSIESDWLPVKICARRSSNRFDHGESIEAAYKTYHEMGDKRPSDDEKYIDPLTIGLYVNKSIIVGGPGMGKSTHLKRLFKEYISDNTLAILITLPDLVKKLKNTGCSFKDGVFSLGCDDANIANDTIFNSEKIVLLLDGLDECGRQQDYVLNKLLNFLESHVNFTVIISTRPIGYNTALLDDWRHYYIRSFDSSNVKANVKKILTKISEEQKSFDIDNAVDSLHCSPNKEILQRSPLLMGLACMLAFKGYDLGSNELELYDNIFKLIDDVPRTRQIEYSFPDTTHNLFLNAVAWTLISNNFAPKAEVLDFCSKVLSAELEINKFQAANYCEELLNYWEGVGVLESLNHADHNTITFIHKSFSEYCAARYFSYMKDEDKAEALKVDQKYFHEVAKFACFLGEADYIVTYDLNSLGSIATEEQYDIVKHCIGLVSPCSEKLSQKVLNNLLVLAFKLISTPLKNKALQIANKLTVIVEKSQNETSKIANKYVDSKYSWCRLSAWTILSQCDEKYFCLESFIEFCKSSDIKPVSKTNSSLLSGGKLRFNFGDPEPDLLEIISLNYLDKLFEHKLPSSNQVASEYIELTGHITIDFKDKLERILNKNSAQKDLHLSLVNKLKELESGYKYPFLGEEYIEQQRLVYKEMLELFILVSGVEQCDKSLNLKPPLKSISALLDATNYWDTPANSHWSWPEKYNKEPLLETLKCVCDLSSIDVIELGNEAHYFIKEFETYPDLYFYDYVPHIDTFFNWEDCKKLNPDSKLLSQAMFFTQDWVRYAAAHLLYNGTDKLTLLELLRTALLEPQNKSSRVFAIIALALGEDGEKVLLEVFPKLEQHAKEFVLQVFNETDEVFNKHQIVRFALEELLPDEETAYQAAKLLDKLYSNENDDLKIIDNAYNHWKVHETPYPERGKARVVPNSPRDFLLPIIVKNSEVRFKQALTFLSDKRGEIVKLGGKCLQELLTNSRESRTMLIDAAVSGSVSLHHLVDAINLNTDFDESQVTLICNLISSSNASFRRAAMAILKEEYLSLDAINEYLSYLINDEEQEIKVEAGEIQYLLST